MTANHSRYLSPLLLLGCQAAQLMPAAAPAPARLPSAQSTRFYVGAAQVDITLPPGVATFGHGPDARVAAGYWTRLACRPVVFVLEDANETYDLALVPCDLAAVSTLLQREVSLRLRAQGRSFPPQRLMLSATHTHAGPAHYFNGSVYGDYASSVTPGFDPQVLSSLADSISEGIASAHDQALQRQKSKRPSRLRWQHGAAWGLTRNRSLAAYLLDQPRFVADVSTPPPAELSEAERAVDPALDLLEIVDPVGERQVPIAWLTWFGIHPTVLPNTNRLLGADLFGVASRLLEQELRRAAVDQGAPSARPVAAFFNTNEGDIAPIWSTGSFDESVQVGRKLAQSVLEVHAKTATPWRDAAGFALAYAEPVLAGNRFGLEGTRRLCDKAELGIASFWGASDHPTRLNALADMITSPIDAQRDDCQAPKAAAFGQFQTLLATNDTFPSQVPLAVVRLDDTWLSFVPAEVTITTGQRINAAVAAVAARTEDGRRTFSRVTGLSNGYIEYVATAEEYDLQRYEGASTLYGRDTARFLSASFAALARHAQSLAAANPAQQPWDVATAYEYATGPLRSRLAPNDTASPAPAFEQLCRVPSSNPERPAFCMFWYDAPPSRRNSPPARHLSLVSTDPKACGLPLIEQIGPALAPLTVADPRLGCTGVLLDDDGYDFRTQVHESVGPYSRWTTVFSPTELEWRKLSETPTAGLRLRVQGARGLAALESPAFIACNGAGQLRECSAQEIRYCGLDE